MKKKRIALVVDKDDWAFANIAKMIKKELSNYYEFEIFPLVYLEGNLAKLFLLVEDFDLIHFLWREPIVNFSKDFFELYTWMLGSSKDDFMAKYVDFDKITTAVYDHLFLEDEFSKTKYIFSHVKKYHVSSSKLFGIYNSLDIEYKPSCVITDGVDLNRFSPKNLERFKNIKDRNLVIGWVGNSNFANGKDDIKGVNTILKPALEELKKEGYKFDVDFADSSVKRVSYEKMPEYYNNIDILVCVSKTEGTPNPILEAMACGIPIISTDVGIVKDAFGTRQSKYILKSRDVLALKEKIIYLLNNKEELKKISDENIKSIKSWSWDYKIKDFKKFFDNCLKEKDDD